MNYKTRSPDPQVHVQKVKLDVLTENCPNCHMTSPKDGTSSVKASHWCHVKDPSPSYGPVLSSKVFPWRLAEFCYNKSLQRLQSGTCTILQETIDRYLCSLFLKSETHQLNLKGVIKLNRNLG